MLNKIETLAMPMVKNMARCQGQHAGPSKVVRRAARDGVGEEELAILGLSQGARVGNGFPKVEKGVLHAVGARVLVAVEDPAVCVCDGAAVAVEDGLLEESEELGPVEPGRGEKDVAPDAVGVGDNGILPAGRHVQAVSVPVHHAEHIGAPPAADESAAGQDLLAGLDPAGEGGPKVRLEKVELLLLGDVAVAGADVEDEDTVRVGGAGPVEVAVGRIAVHGTLVSRVGDLVELGKHVAALWFVVFLYLFISSRERSEQQTEWISSIQSCTTSCGIAGRLIRAP